MQPGIQILPTDFTLIPPGTVRPGAFFMGFDVNNNDALTMMDDDGNLYVIGGGTIPVIGASTLFGTDDSGNLYLLDNPSNDIIAYNVGYIYAVIVCSTTTTTLISFPNLLELFGGINFDDVTALQQLLFPKLKTFYCSYFSVVNCAALLELNFPSLVTLYLTNGIDYQMDDNVSLTQITYPSLTSILGTTPGANVDIDISGNTLLTNIDFSKLVTAVDDGTFTIFVDNAPNLTTFDLSNLTNSANFNIYLEVTGLISFSIPLLKSAYFIDIYENNDMSSISFDSLLNNTQFSISYNALTSISIPLLQSSDFILSNENSLPSLSAPKLTSDSGSSGNGISIQFCSSLTTISFPLLASALGGFIIASTAIVSLTLPALSTTGTHNFTVNNSNSDLLTVSIPALITANSVIISTNTSLTTITFNATLFSNCKTFDFSENALNQVTVDNILQLAVNGGLSNGTLNLSGGFNSAPSAGGTANAAILTGLGWTVSTN